MDMVQIMVTCKACSGVSYLASSITIDEGEGRCITTYQPCYACQGSGVQIVWIDLREFARLLDAIATESRPG